MLEDVSWDGSTVSGGMNPSCSMQIYFLTRLVNLKAIRVDGRWRASQPQVLFKLRSTLKLLDTLTDAAMAALWYRQYRSGACAWHGEQGCEVYLVLFTLTTCAAVVAYLCAFTLAI